MSKQGRNVGTGAATTLEEEAERWFVRMLEPDSPEDIAAFERWKAADPARAAAYRAVEAAWQRSGEAAADPAVMAAARRVWRETTPGLVARRSRSAWLAIAAAVVVLLAVAGLLARRSAPPPGIRYATVVGEQRTVKLPDGSTVLLDTDTAMLERYDVHERRVDLLRGQAQFQDVLDGASRPFIVHVQDGTVTALGTRFQVRTDGDETSVVLLEGAVNVVASAGSASAVLTPGERVAFDRTGRLGPVRHVDADVADGWPQGRLFVHDWRLADLVAEMNRYSDIRLELADASLRDLRISGVFRAGDQRSLATILQRGWPIRTETGPAGQIVLRRR